MKELSKAVHWHDVAEEAAGQRIDNYLTRLLKGVPKSHIYRILRGGEVRVNSGRVTPDYRVSAGDRVRIPPVRVARKEAGGVAMPGPPLHVPVLYEDETLLVLDKPSGLAVHGGSGVSFGVIERLRQSRGDIRFLELVHRLDRDTSGVLMLAKKRAALTALHAQLRAGSVRKFYLTLVHGTWQGGARDVQLPLHKHVLASGERRVSIREGGMSAHTRIRLRKRLGEFSLLEAELKTGRTHQIRVHLAHLGFPIAGDEKYGDFTLNKQLARQGLKRMFLHACKTVIEHPETREKITLEAPLPAELQDFLRVPGLQSL
ncbi:MAG: RluA family pseudouridine synthase [Betaproteobacteria bacterium]